jgi:ABC-type transporter Mla maintaining outer membrane lipid asymmetry ATPase subunit MlaF
MTEPAIDLRDVRCDGIGEPEPLNVSLSVAAGACVVLLGSARSGARTVLRLCAGLLEPDAGTVRVLGRDPADSDEESALEHRLRVGVVLQPPGLLSNMSVFNNVALPLRFHGGHDEGTIATAVERRLAELGLVSIRDQFPSMLTLGEVKAVALARALVMEPDLLLLEDADAGLDAELMARCRAAIQVRRARRPMTLLATMSHPSPLQVLADRVVYLREGAVVAEGPRDELMTSAAAEVLAYLGG